MASDLEALHIISKAPLFCFREFLLLPLSYFWHYNIWICIWVSSKRGTQMLLMEWDCDLWFVVCVQQMKFKPGPDRMRWPMIDFIGVCSYHRPDIFFTTTRERERCDDDRLLTHSLTPHSLIHSQLIAFPRFSHNVIRPGFCSISLPYKFTWLLVLCT